MDGAALDARGMWFDVDAVPLSFTRTSPFQIENVVVIDAPASRVFQIIATAEAQKDWFQDFVACRWTTAEPRAIGAEREIELRLLTVKERFLAWQPSTRIAFHVYAITLPLVTAMVEDMVLAAESENTTRLTWTVHYRPSLVMRLFHPIGRMIFSKMFKASAEGLARYAKANPN